MRHICLLDDFEFRCVGIRLENCWIVLFQHNLVHFFGFDAFTFLLILWLWGCNFILQLRIRGRLKAFVLVIVWTWGYSTYFQLSLWVWWTSRMVYLSVLLHLFLFNIIVSLLFKVCCFVEESCLLEISEVIENFLLQRWYLISLLLFHSLLFLLFFLLRILLHQELISLSIKFIFWLFFFDQHSRSFFFFCFRCVFFFKSVHMLILIVFIFDDLVL